MVSLADRGHRARGTRARPWRALSLLSVAQDLHWRARTTTTCQSPSLPPERLELLFRDVLSRVIADPTHVVPAPACAASTDSLRLLSLFVSRRVPPPACLSSRRRSGQPLQGGGIPSPRRLLG